MPSKALEVNLAISQVDVTISDQYKLLQEVMSRYQGIMDNLNTFLKELCHPYKNWQFIVKEARGYALDYFHLLKTHPKGPQAAKIYFDIFLEAIDTSQDSELKADSVDNLLLYIQKIIGDSGEEIQRFLNVFNYVFKRIEGYENENFFLFVKSYYQINRLAERFMEKAAAGTDFKSINSLLIKYLNHTYSYWLGEEDSLTWFSREVDSRLVQSQEIKTVFHPLSHVELERYKRELESTIRENEKDSETLLKELTPLPGYNQIVDVYREIPQRLLKGRDNGQEGNHLKLIFLFHIMDNTGLSSIHKETLRDINRTLTWLIGQARPQDLERLIQKTFEILKVSIQRYPTTALHCIMNMGKAVYKTDDSDLVDSFIESVVNLGFQYPELKGVGDDWQMRANAAHIQNIRTWLELIEINPKWSKKLLSSLIINLSLSGIYIKDTDLFPRDITQLLNSDIGPVYNLVKQLARLFPAFFNDIGAEGRLRDISTRIDEISFRKDVLIHFLRKQSHVASSNQIIGFMEATLDFWKTRNKEGLEPFVPPHIYQQIETTGPYIDGVHRVISHLFKKEQLTRIGDLLKVKEQDIKDMGCHISGVTDNDLERVELAITFYRLLYLKYRVGSLELDNYMKQLQPAAFPDLEKLKTVLSESDTRQKLFKLLSYLERLKKLILSSDTFEIREDIYRKRHFAVDIPSMYGSYHEMKFDTLGLTFRLESLVNTLFEELVESIDLKLITKNTFSIIYDYLWLFFRALRLDGILSAEMERQLDLLACSLEIREFSFTQFLDIFRGFSLAVKNIVNDYFNSLHHRNLIKILDQLDSEILLPKYRPQEGPIDKEKLIHRVTEIFLRERIATTLGLQQLDLFISRIMNTLFQQSNKLPREGLRILLSYDPQKVVTPITPVNKRIADIIHLGNKGLNLVRLKGYGFPIPPGFIITTELFRCREVINRYPPADKNLKEQLTREISALEKLTGKSFGNPKNPLLLSIRSGAPISQPGMMDTFLDVGINEDIASGISDNLRKEWFAWDCYRRFLQSYGMAFGLKRDDFDDIIAEFKQEHSIPYKRDFTGEQMKRVALTYKEFILDNRIKIEESPFEQLNLVISKVFNSWYTNKAKTYRRIMGISDDWGTAVTVQSMVFGNLSQKSGAGVVFTHSPRWSGDMVMLWGDYTLGNQGEDVVSGLVKTLPISNKQAELENREGDLTLETHFPEIYHTIRELAKYIIYTKKWGPQEMEFTFETPLKNDLYFLQTRDMAIRDRKMVVSFVTPSSSESRLLGHGIGVSGGAMSGRVVFNLEEVHKWREKEPNTSLILVRGDTVPDDIKEIYGADGLLTARGGSTSHAAIVAHRLGKTCVVGCANLVVMEKESSCSLDHVRLKTGDWISIDGLEGSIYSGMMEIEEVGRR